MLAVVETERRRLSISGVDIAPGFYRMRAHGRQEHEKVLRINGTVVKTLVEAFSVFLAESGSKFALKFEADPPTPLQKQEIFSNDIGAAKTECVASISAGAGSSNNHGPQAGNISF